MPDIDDELKTAQPTIDPSRPRYLEPGKLRFQRQAAVLQMTVEGETSYRDIKIVRLFPLHQPDQYLSVQNDNKEEIGIIMEVAELDAESRRLVAEELERRYLMPVVRRIVRIKERFGTVDWWVETSRGSRKFTMRDLRENLMQPSPNRFLLTDVDGNRYDVSDIEALDAASRAFLMRYL